VHDIGGGKTWRGEATVENGPSWLARMVRALTGLPPTVTAVPLVIEMAPDGDGETWHRRFGGHRLTTRMLAGKEPNVIEETLWPLTAVSRLEPDAAGVQQVPIGFRFLGLPLPRFLWPSVEARESAEGGVYRFKVVMGFRGIAIEAYEGWLEIPEDS
jgi:uncharacterized protein DUF4166